MFYATYTALQIPATILISRTARPQLFLALICIGWGAASAATAVMPNLLGFNICRFLIGVFQAGAFPCIWYYISILIPPTHYTLAFVGAELGLSAGQSASAPIAWGTFQLDGALGIDDW